MSRRIHLQCSLADYQEGQSGGSSDTLLCRGNDNVEVPLVKLNLLGSNGTDCIDHDECVGAVFTNDLGVTSERAEGSSRCIDYALLSNVLNIQMKRYLTVCDGDHFILFSLQGLDQLLLAGVFSLLVRPTRTTLTGPLRQY